MAIWRKVLATFICFMMFLILYIILRNGWIVVISIAPGPEYGLLLFLLPGMVTSLISRDSAIFSSFVGGLVSIPVCFLLRLAFYPRVRPLVQELAYATSAIFWCVLGAMLVQMLLIAYQQFRQH
ncbi:MULTISPECIES: inner membrane protein YbjM [Rahnella]|uniref:inner membrane protein YbjM n=2 Tax=Yersiniaceae TaxID=1903411 RepID=UPI000DD48F6B|nr:MULTISPECIES: inner membrane protein YbjM [Rahnella]MDH2898908.1 inner membrane protein YbjM [Rahnella variigena]